MTAPDSRPQRPSDRPRAVKRPLGLAALAANPRLASSLYGRGLAKLRSGATADGERDIAKARALDPNIVNEFTGYGVR